MGSKIKISKDKKQQRGRTEFPRKTNQKSKRIYYLIVCEGEKTEPNYFKSLKQSLPKGVLDVCDITIEGTGFNTKSLVKEAIRLKGNLEKEKERKIDKLWIVFDKDSFAPQDFNAAIQKCKNNYPSINAAWSNEAFELWYLLHFHFYNTGISRKQYQDLIEGNFKKKGLLGYEYKKNSTEMFDLLEKYGSRSNAIKHATKLEKFHAGKTDFANQNPCTKVHHLVKELFDLT